MIIPNNTVKQGFPIKITCKSDSILPSFEFYVLVSKIDPLRFFEVAINSLLAFYSIRAITTLTEVDCGSPLLRIDDDKNLSQTRYSSKAFGHLVLDNSIYLGLPLRLGIRSTAQTAKEI